MIRAGAMRCLRGFPNRKRAEYTLVYHSGKDFIFEVVTNSQLKPTFVIPKKDILSIDLLLLDNLEKKCNSFFQLLIYFCASAFSRCQINCLVQFFYFSLIRNAQYTLYWSHPYRVIIPFPIHIQVRRSK